MGKKHTCPKRAAKGMDLDDTLFPWSGKNLDSYDDDICTYCGAQKADEAVLIGKKA